MTTLNPYISFRGMAREAQNMRDVTLSTARVRENP